MKKGKYHIINAWILLICFIAGQYMIYAHQHNIIKGHQHAYSIKQLPAKQTVAEKCQLCDAMHHTNMVMSATIFHVVVAVSGHVYKNVEYNFTSLALILSGGRAPPPSAIYCC